MVNATLQISAIATRTRIFSWLGQMEEGEAATLLPESSVRHVHVGILRLSL